MVKRLYINEANKGYSSKVYDALQADFADSDGKVDPVYLSDQVEMWLMNTKKVYDQMFNNRRKSYSVAYEAMLDLFQDVADRYDTGVRVTSEMAKRWLSKNGMDYKEVLKPVIARVEEEKEERRNESVYSFAGRKHRRRMNEEVGYGFVRLGTIDDDAYISTHKRGYKSFYDSEDGYQQFTKRIGDFSIKIMSTDDPGHSTISVSTQKYDLNKLDRELSDLTFNTEEDLIELERRLSELSGGYRESLNSKSRRSRSMREARSGRKTYTQKQLRDMVRSGKAIDVTTYSFDDANELWQRGYEVVGISRGVYGLNGALLKMNDTGELCAITARNSTLSQLV